jgi:hypothetical protein
MRGRKGSVRQSEKQLTPFRALTAFDVLPPEHKTFRVSDGDSAPHLKINEFAVIDTTDRELQKGEIYLIQYESGERNRRIVQIRTGYISSYPSGREVLVWWATALAGFRATGETMFGGIPVFAGLSDGPYNARYLKKKLLGRVVGYAQAPLGGLLEPSLGWAD